jgi:adenylosuccinate synthase
MAVTKITESTSLEMHVELCAERYNRLEEKFEMVEARLDSLHQDFNTFKAENSKNMADIKSMLTNAKDEKFKVMITVAGTVIVSLIGFLGYLLTHLSK